MTVSRRTIPCLLAWRFLTAALSMLTTAIVWLVSASSPVAGQTKGKTACELVTATEIAKVLNVAAVKKDETNSGEHVMGHVDICNWYIKEN
jgi:hypothetical protein